MAGAHINATETALLVDLHGAVDKAIASRTFFCEFQADFERIMARRGRTQNGPMKTPPAAGAALPADSD